MDRREFLKTLAAGSAMVLLPNIATTEPIGVDLLTVDDLTRWMEKRYECFNGQPMSFMELDAPMLASFGLSMKHIPVENTVPDENGEQRIRIIYSTVAYAMEADDPAIAQHAIVKAVCDSFEKYAPPQKLIWRVKPQFDTGPITYYGDTYMSWEEIHDKGMPESLPPNVEMDFDTDSFRYVVRRATLNKVRMRLAFPTMPDEDYDAFCINEGCSPRRIT